MQKMLERLGKESAIVGLKINIKKTKEMRIAVTNKEPLYIHNEIIERVTQFTYLGSIIDNTGELTWTLKLVYERPKQHLVH